MTETQGYFSKTCISINITRVWYCWSQWYENWRQVFKTHQNYIFYYQTSKIEIAKSSVLSKQGNYCRLFIKPLQWIFFITHHDTILEINQEDMELYIKYCDVCKTVLKDADITWIRDVGRSLLCVAHIMNKYMYHTYGKFVKI